MQRFGGRHTDEKLKKLQHYLDRYTTALKNQNFRLIYFDAFAGTGGIEIGDDAPLLQHQDDYRLFIQGSAHRALEFGFAFDKYMFVEKSRKKVRELVELCAKFPVVKDRVKILRADANEALLEFCAKTNWQKTRAVVFLDPYGNQVDWRTIEAIAETQAIDLWYLFPAGLGVYRQIAKHGVHESHEASLDKILGTTKWRDVFIKVQPVDDLFGTHENVVKQATVESITEFMAARMKTVFKGGVLDQWLPLGSRGIHMYSLMFAWANPGEKAKLAGKLAAAVLRSDEHGRVERH